MGLRLVDRYKSIIDCNGNFDAKTTTLSPMQFHEKVGFFVVATATFPDVPVDEALVKFSQLCMNYGVQRQQLLADQHQQLMDQATVAVETGTAPTVKSCCGGGTVL